MSQLSTRLTIILSVVVVFFLSVSLQKSFSQVSGKCEGSISFTLSPNDGFVGDTITASVTGLRGEGCLGKRVHIKESSCDGLQYCSCQLNRMTGGSYGCLCTFRAPPTPYVSGTESSRQNRFSYYACTDLDNDGIYTMGEQSQTSLLVSSRYVTLSMLTESIIIIVSLGVLLIITILVFRMSARRR